MNAARLVPALALDCCPADPPEVAVGVLKVGCEAPAVRRDIKWRRLS
jgi:hypothetical protein